MITDFTKTCLKIRKTRKCFSKILGSILIAAKTVSFEIAKSQAKEH